MKYLLVMSLCLLAIHLSAQNKDFFDLQPTLKAWVKERVTNSEDGKKEIVEIPLAVRSKAWGCRCPNHYIGISTNNREGPWLRPITPKKFPVSDDEGSSLIVTGYFTGKQITKDYRKTKTDPKDWVYTLPEFKILSWRKNELAYDIDSPKILKKH
ncbi:MAG: hypothetical protein ACRBFS_20575 [Aureispira sp.]